MAYLFIRRQGISSHLQTIWGARVFHPVALLKLMFLSPNLSMDSGLGTPRARALAYMRSLVRRLNESVTSDRAIRMNSSKCEFVRNWLWHWQPVLVDAGGVEPKRPCLCPSMGAVTKWEPGPSNQHLFHGRCSQPAGETSCFSSLKLS